jgi:hypothetical protein
MRVISLSLSPLLLRHTMQRRRDTRDEDGSQERKGGERDSQNTENRRHKRLTQQHYSIRKNPRKG